MRNRADVVSDQDWHAHILHEVEATRARGDKAGLAAALEELKKIEGPSKAAVAVAKKEADAAAEVEEAKTAERAAGKAAEEEAAEAAKRGEEPQVEKRPRGRPRKEQR